MLLRLLLGLGLDRREDAGECPESRRTVVKTVVVSVRLLKLEQNRLRNFLKAKNHLVWFGFYIER